MFCTPCHRVPPERRRELGWEGLWLQLAQRFLSHLYGASELLLDFVNYIFLNLYKPLHKSVYVLQGMIQTL